MSKLTAICLALTPPVLAAGGAVAGASPVEVVLPSGARVIWQETRHDTSGGLGLTYRFRFVMPDLARLVPATSGPASDFEDAEGRGPIDIDTESGDVSGEGADAGMIDEAAMQAEAEQGAEDGAEDGAEQDADALVEEALPAAPDVLAEDPIHLDIVWLCENWALPRIASPAPRPRQIIISLASKETAFGAYDPEVVQLFEAFRLPPDRDACEWEPW